MHDETLRLHEYSPGFAPELFAAHEEFFVDDVRRWVRQQLGVELAMERTAVFGVSAGGELALALGLRHAAIYGAIFCASPGAGYRPPNRRQRSMFTLGCGERSVDASLPLTVVLCAVLSLSHPLVTLVEQARPALKGGTWT